MNKLNIMFNIFTMDGDREGSAISLDLLIPNREAAYSLIDALTKTAMEYKAKLDTTRSSESEIDDRGSIA